jgi:hypothetical protein
MCAPGRGPTLALVIIYRRVTVILNDHELSLPTFTTNVARPTIAPCCTMNTTYEPVLWLESIVSQLSLDQLLMYKTNSKTFAVFA